MIATINDKEKTITLECSFKHQDFIEWFNKLPEEWQEFEFKIGEGKQNWIPTTWTYPTISNDFVVTCSNGATSCCGGDCQAKSE